MKKPIIHNMKKKLIVASIVPILAIGVISVSANPKSPTIMTKEVSNTQKAQPAPTDTQPVQQASTQQTAKAATTQSEPAEQATDAPQNPYADAYGDTYGIGFVWKQFNAEGKTLPDVGTYVLTATSNTQGGQPVDVYFSLLTKQSYQFATTGSVGDAIIYSFGSGRMGIITQVNEDSYTVQMSDTATATVPISGQVAIIN